MFEYYNASPWLPSENIFSRTTLQRAHTYILGTSPNKLHSQKKHFSLFARVAHIPAKPDYPRQNCLLSKTYFKGSGYVYPTTVMGLINPRIKKKKKKYLTFQRSLDSRFTCPVRLIASLWTIVRNRQNLYRPIVPRNLKALFSGGIAASPRLP